MKKQTTIILDDNDIMALTKATQIMYEVRQIIGTNLFGIEDMRAITDLAMGINVEDSDFLNLGARADVLRNSIKGEK